MDALYRQNDYVPDAPGVKRETEEDWGKPRNIMNKTWQLVELYGCWWAYEGEMPPPEAYRTHGHDGHILWPVPTRALGEAGLPRRLSRRETRVPANPSGGAPRRRGWR